MLLALWTWRTGQWAAQPAKTGVQTPIKTRRRVTVKLAPAPMQKPQVDPELLLLAGVI